MHFYSILFNISGGAACYRTAALDKDISPGYFDVHLLSGKKNSIWEASVSEYACNAVCSRPGYPRGPDN